MKCNIIATLVRNYRAGEQDAVYRRIPVSPHWIIPTASGFRAVTSLNYRQLLPTHSRNSEDASRIDTHRPSVQLISIV